MTGRLFHIAAADVDVGEHLGCLRRSDGDEVYLRQKTFQLLLYLLEHRGRVVTKDELTAQVWGDVAVTDDALVQCIGEIRRALGDDPRNPRYVRTLPKSGYRFIGQVDEIEPTPASETARTDGRPVVVEEVTSVQIEIDGESSEIAAMQPLQLSAASGDEASRRRILLAGIGIALVAGTTFVYLTSASRGHTPASAPETTLAAEPGRQSVAVMFLDNQSQAKEVDWLREGIAEMLITGLSRVRTLNVLGRQQLAILLQRIGHEPDTNITLGEALEIARRSRVDHVVLGSFSKLGERIRIDLRLQDARGRTTAAESLTVDSPDRILTEVDLLSWKLAQHLGGVSAETRLVPSSVLTRNLDAYRYYSLGLNRANAHRNTEAIELFTKAIELDPEFALAHARIGYVYAVTWGLYRDRAKPYLARAYASGDRLSEKDRLYVEAWHGIANDDFDSAITALQRVISLYPAELEAYSRLGLLLSGERRYNEALEVFGRGVALDSESGELYNRLGATYTELGRHEEAIAARRKYVALAPSEPNAHDSLGLSYLWAGRYEEALAEYQRALELKPDFDIALVHLGDAFFQLGRYGAAQEQYRKYQSVAPSRNERARAYGNLSRVALRRGNQERALELARLEAQHARPGLGLLLAVVAAERGAPIESAQKTVPVLSRFGRGYRASDRITFCLYGQLALRGGRTAEALEHFRTAMQQAPPYWYMDAYEDCLANAYLEMGRPNEAAAEYQRILRLNPRYPLVHYRLALAYERLQRPDDARRAYEQFLDVWKTADPDVPEVKAARARLKITSSPTH